MNGTASHLTTGVMSWIEHEEIVLLSILRKLLEGVDKLVEPMIDIGLFALIAYIFLSVLPQFTQCAQLISDYNLPALFLCIW
jgi:hypothetical protein